MGLVDKDPLVRLLEELTKRMASARASLAGGNPPETDGARGTGEVTRPGAVSLS